MFLVHLLSQTQGKEGCTSGTALDPFFHISRENLLRSLRAEIRCIFRCT